MHNERLRKLRQMVGLSQFNVARRSGVARTRISLFENGDVELTTRELGAVREVLEEAASELRVAIESLSPAQAATIL